MRHTTLFKAATLALVTGAAIPSSPAFAAYRCDNPTAPFDLRACAIAAQGPDALRRYIERTRGIYSLYFFDYARVGAPAVAATEPVRMAAAPAPAAR